MWEVAAAVATGSDPVAAADPARAGAGAGAGAATSATSAQRAGLAGLLAAGGVLVLSGAGLSTDSGIPDYRGPSGVLRRHAPMTYQAFVEDPAARHRYWARSHLGWPRIAAAAPNAGHRAVADWQRAGLLAGIITQNVDGLHQAAGAGQVMELHGGLDRVVCLACGAVLPRVGLDAALRAANPGYGRSADQALPDGDADLAEGRLEEFVMVSCPGCGGGPLKPDVVFFGESVPRPRVQFCFDLLAGATALLVLGSSLSVMSGYRFVLRAAALGVPVAIVNQGPTRGDAQAALRLDAPLSEVLPAVLG